MLSVGLSTFNHFFCLHISNLTYSVQWKKKQLVRTVMSNCYVYRSTPIINWYLILKAGKMQDVHWNERLVAVTGGVLTPPPQKKYWHSTTNNWSVHVFLFLKNNICIYERHTSRETRKYFIRIQNRLLPIKCISLQSPTRFL